MERIKNLYLCELPYALNEERTVVVGRDGRAVFDVVGNVDASFAAALTAKLNGVGRHTVPEPFTAQEESIAYDGRRILDIRGWGWLTEVCGLTGREAEEEQQEFIAWCVGRLNGGDPL